MRREDLVLLVVLLWCAACIGCGPQDAGQGFAIGIGPTESPPPIPTHAVSANPDAVTLNGSLQFDKIVAVPNGSGGGRLNLVQKPARFVDVEARDVRGKAVSPRVATDANGKFTLVVQPDTDFFVVAISSSSANGGRFNADVRSPEPGLPLYVFAFGNGSATEPIPGFGPNAILNFTSPIIVPVDPTEERVAGAFSILDACLDASDVVAAANNGVPLRKMTYLWTPDPILDSGISAFTGDFSPFSPGPTTFIRGGNSDTSDTDEYDDDVIHHEYGHFMIAELSRDASLGGVHSAVDDVFPSLAYSEGLANWFAGVVSANPVLLDIAMVTAPVAKGFTLFNLEGTPAVTLPRGLTSESSVGEILWDITDGVENRPDTDSDGLALTFGAVLNALKTLKGSKSYVVVTDLLQALINTGAMTVAQVNAILAAPQAQNIIFTGADTFPPTIAQGTTVNDTVTTIDVVGPDSGADVANRFFKFDLNAGATVNVSMTLFNVTGTNGDGTNADLFLFDTSNVTRASSQLETATEQISASLPAGRYYINVSGRPSPFEENATNTVSTTITYQLRLQ